MTSPSSLLLKRKLSSEIKMGSSSSECSLDQDGCGPPKRMRAEAEAEKPSSVNTQLETLQADEGRKEVVSKVVRLKEKGKAGDGGGGEEELREKIARLEEEARLHSTALAALNRANEAVSCAVCHNAIRNPQVMACGHAGCYRCLRRWWIMPVPGERRVDDGGDEISTEGDSDSGDDDKEEQEEEERTKNDNAKDATSSEPGPSSSSSSNHPPPHPRLYFRPVTSCPKQCPECKRTVHRRPIPDFHLRHIVDALRLVPLSPEAQAARDKRWGRRLDIWRGIFPVEEVEMGQNIRPFGVVDRQGDDGDGGGEGNHETNVVRAEADDMRRHMDTVLRMLDDARARRRELVERERRRERRPRLTITEIIDLQARYPGLPRFDVQRAREAEEGVGEVLRGSVPPPLPPRERAPSPEALFQMGSRSPSPLPPPVDIFIGPQLQSQSRPGASPPNSNLPQPPMEQHALDTSSNVSAPLPRPELETEPASEEVEVEATLRYPEDLGSDPHAQPNISVNTDNTGEVATTPSTGS